MDVVMFDTLQEAETRQEEDYDTFTAGITNQKYLDVTTKWAEPRERIDGKFDYVTCSKCDYGGLATQEYNEDNYSDSYIQD